MPFIPNRKNARCDRVISSVVCLIFFISGAAALIFEIVWFRQLGFVFGVGVQAAAIVMASFMAGIGAGNALASGGRLQKVSPLRAFAVLEFVTAATGGILVFLLPALPAILAPLFQKMLGQAFLINVFRSAISFLLLIVPTTAMGATLPILVRALSSIGSNFGSVLGKLYGANTLGAVAGVVAAELLLIEKIGLKNTGLFAAALCIFAAVGIIAIPRSILSKTNIKEVGIIVMSKIPSNAWLILVSSFLAGFALLSLEILWLRTVLLFVLGTGMAFAALIAAVLSGIGLGGALASSWLKKDGEAHRFSGVILCMCAATLLFCFAKVGSVIGLYDWYAHSQFFSILPLGFAIAFLPSLFSGIIFVFFGALLETHLKNGQRAAAFVTLSNTAGACIGSLVGGFFLLPHLGIEKSILLLAILYGVIAILFIWSAKNPFHRGCHSEALAEESHGDNVCLGFGAQRGMTKCSLFRIFQQPAKGQRKVVYSSVILFVVSLIFFPFGIVQDKYGPYPAREYEKNGEKIVSYREGITENIIYTRKEVYGKPYYHRLITNSYSMSSTTPVARRYMKLFVYLPVALNPDIKNALLISYGVGSTARALVDTKGIEKIDIVDISREILEMGCTAFVNGSCPLGDPRVRTHIEDGRHFLLTSGEKYDLITAEPPPPKNAGISNLYSLEYFELMREKLRGGGMATYWLPVVQLEQKETRAIIRAFCGAFSDCSLWAPSIADWMLLGTKDAKAKAPDEKFSAQWNDPIIGPEIRGLGIETPEQLGALFLADAKTLKEITADTRPLVDDRPYIISPSPTNPVAMFRVYSGWMDAAKAGDKFKSSTFIAKLIPEKIRKGASEYFEFQPVINNYLTVRPKDSSIIIEDMNFVLTRSKLRAPVLWMLGGDMDTQSIANHAFDGGEMDSAICYQLGIGALSRREYKSAMSFFGKALDFNANGDFAFLEDYKKYAECMTGAGPIGVCSDIAQK